MFKLKKKEKPVKMYGLVNSNQPDIFLTIGTNTDQLGEYAHKLIRLEHAEHYVLWCQCRNMELTDDSWNEYFNTCVVDDEKTDYKIISLFYTREQLAQILRMFMGAIPLGCTYDSPFEFSFLKSKIDENKDDELNEIVNKNMQFLDEKLKDILQNGK